MSCQLPSPPTSYPRVLRRLSWRRRIACAALSLAASQLVALASLAAQDSASIHYKGVTVTPGGYFAAEFVWRQKQELADIGSNFNAIPFPGTTQSFMPEFRGSARQSRFALGISGTVDSTRLAGYMETDFLSAGVTSNSNQSNSYTLRIRQFWGQALLPDGWGFVAGQAWSTLTTEKNGVAPRNEFSPLTIDAQYAAGFNWARQWQLRGWKGFNNSAWIVGAVEGAATTFGGHGLPSNYVVGGPGGSLLNSTANYSADLSPDLIGKIVFEPGFGHYELKALGRVFRSRIIDPTGAVGGTRNSQVYGGGVGAAAVWSVNVNESGKRRDVLDFGVSGLWGSGIGRYGTSQLPDVTVRPNGVIAPIHAAQGLVSFESHPSRKLDIYGYGGAEYAYRTTFATAKGPSLTGYGLPFASNAGCTVENVPTSPFTPVAGTCNADTRVVWQGVGGFWYKFAQGSFGTFQAGLQYSYTSRETWSGAASLEPNALDQMVFGSVRYVIP